MPITIRRLDTHAPPEWLDTWSGVDDFADNPFTDANTSLRATVRHDKVNYFTSQRTEGDLFKRDQVTELNCTNLNNFLGTRTGMVFNQPSVRLPANQDIKFAAFTIPGDNTAPKWILVGWGLSNHTDGVASFELRLMKVGVGTPLATKTSLETTWTVPSDFSTRGLLLDAGASYEVYLKNGANTRKIGSAWVALQPRNH